LDELRIYEDETSLKTGRKRFGGFFGSITTTYFNKFYNFSTITANTTIFISKVQYYFVPPSSSLEIIHYKF
jgi:hypothetical protein